MGFVIAVSGAVGGIGTSTFAYALALQARPDVVLIDARSDGTPLDLLIGAETEPGTRWHQIHVSRTDLDADMVLSALPEWQGIRFLSASRQGTAQAAALDVLTTTLRGDDHTLVVDVSARSSMLDLLQPDLHVLCVPNTIYGLGAALPSMRDDTVLVVMRSLTEDFRADDLGKYVPQPRLGVVEPQREIAMAMRARMPLPPKSSVMRAAADVMTRLHHAE